MEKNIMYNFSKEDHVKRLSNIKFINEHIKKYLTKNLIADYIQGQFIYPSKVFYSDEENEKLIKQLADAGVGLIQIWEDMGRDENGVFHDYSHRLIDGKMYRPYGKKQEETRNFLSMAHKYGIKVIPYTSTNFYMRSDEHFDPAWALDSSVDLAHLAHCSINSPGWRAEMLRQFAGILDEYDYDGIYIDCGYIRNSDYRTDLKHYYENPKAADDDILAFDESPNHDGGMEDFLSLIYSEVKSRGKIFKLHKEGVDRIRSDWKLYDYLWVGEAVRDINFIRKSVKSYQPYVVPDYNFAIEDEQRYLNTIPYMQFPVVRNGKMGIGAPDVGFPDFDRQLRWLKLYKRLTTTGTYCYTEADIPAIVRNNSENTVVSLFVNDVTYIVLANYGSQPSKPEILYPYIELDIDGGETGSKRGELTLDSGSIKVLKLCKPFDAEDNRADDNLQDCLIDA